MYSFIYAISYLYDLICWLFAYRISISPRSWSSKKKLLSFRSIIRNAIEHRKLGIRRNLQMQVDFSLSIILGKTCYASEK